MTFQVAKFRDVSEGLQPGQFAVGERDQAQTLEDLDPIYKQLLDDPVPMVLAVMAPDGRPNLTPMWFDYEGNKVLINVASHRRKAGWIRANPVVTLILVDPKNAYHWVSMRAKVVREISEDDPNEGKRVTEHLDKIWTKFTGNEPPYGLRDPSIDERRILFECEVERVATFGKP